VVIDLLFILLLGLDVPPSSGNSRCFSCLWMGLVFVDVDRDLDEVLSLLMSLLMMLDTSTCGVTVWVRMGSHNRYMLEVNISPRR
jgi:hypothetical protein